MVQACHGRAIKLHSDNGEVGAAGMLWQNSAGALPWCWPSAWGTRRLEKLRLPWQLLQQLQAPPWTRRSGHWGVLMPLSSQLLLPSPQEVDPHGSHVPLTDINPGFLLEQSSAVSHVFHRS